MKTLVKTLQIALFFQLAVCTAFGADDLFQAIQGRALMVPLPDITPPAQIKDGGKLPKTLYCSKESCQVLIAIPLSAKPGNSQEVFSVTKGKDSTETFELPFSVKSDTFVEQVLQIPKEYVEYTGAVLKRVRSEQDAINTIISRRYNPRILPLPFSLPIPPDITTPFGAQRTLNKTTKQRHYGVDLRCSTGTPIRAVNDGIVVLADSYHINGNFVMLNHGEALFSNYNHLSVITVRPGESVKQGDIVGLCGTTGRSTGPHLHFGITIADQSINPLTFIEATSQAPVAVEKVEQVETN